MGGGVPDAGVLATILLIVGLFLLALELMIPSFGMIGILSAIALLISAWCAWQAWWGTSPGFFWTYCAFWLLGIPSVLGGVLFVLQNTTLGDHIVLRGPEAESPESSTTANNELAALIGKQGQAASLLTPGGMVSVENQRYHAESPGMMIESGSPVTVVGVRGTRLVVRRYDPDLTPERPENGRPQEQLADSLAATEVTNATTEDARRTGDDTGILDFDIPEG